MCRDKNSVAVTVAIICHRYMVFRRRDIAYGGILVVTSSSLSEKVILVRKKFG